MTLLLESTVAFERHVLAAVAGSVIDRTQDADGSWRRTVDAFDTEESITARHDNRKEDSP